MFRMLNIGDPEWVGLVVGLGPNRRDLHLDQRLSVPYVSALGWKSHLAVTENSDGYIVQPILITDKNEIRHSYNFGGSVGSTDLLNSKEHVESLENWARERDIKSQHITLIPSLNKIQLRLLSSSGIEPQYRKQSVIVDLKDQKVRGTTRRLANKAKTLGVKVKNYPLDTHLEIFCDMYLATMDRAKAKDHWYFPFKWFKAFARLVNPCLMMAEYNGQIEAGCLLVYSHQYKVSYYHFAGSYNRFPSLGINHLLVLSACEFIKSIGLQFLYLGGGITDSDDDSLLMFKKGFSKDLLPVYTYRTIYNNGLSVNDGSLGLGCVG